MIREPLSGMSAQIPVDNVDNHRHMVASSRKAVEYLLQAASLEATRLFLGDRTLTLPGISLTIRQMIKAPERVAGQETTALLQHAPDPFIMYIVDNWPKEFECQKALRLGFEPDKSCDDITSLVKCKP